MTTTLTVPPPPPPPERIMSEWELGKTTTSQSKGKRLLRQFARCSKGAKNAQGTSRNGKMSKKRIENLGRGDASERRFSVPHQS